MKRCIKVDTRLGLLPAASSRARSCSIPCVPGPPCLSPAFCVSLHLPMLHHGSRLEEASGIVQLSRTLARPLSGLEHPRRRPLRQSSQLWFQLQLQFKLKPLWPARRAHALKGGTSQPCDSALRSLISASTFSSQLAAPHPTNRLLFNLSFLQRAPCSPRVSTRPTYEHGTAVFVSVGRRMLRKKSSSNSWNQTSSFDDPVILDMSQ